MPKNGTGKFIQGAVVGMALGVAAAMFLSSKRGKKFRKEAKDVMVDFYKHIAPKVKKLGKITRDEYEKFMGEAAGQYGKAKKMSSEKIDEMIEEAQNSWDYFNKEE